MASVTPEKDAAIQAYLAQRAGVLPMPPPPPVPTALSPQAIAAGPVPAVSAPLTIRSSAPLTPAAVEDMNALDDQGDQWLNQAAAESAARRAGPQAAMPQTEQGMTAPVPATAPPPAAGPRVIPAGWDPKRNPIRASTLAAIDKANADERASVERSGQNAAGELIQRAEMIDQHAQRLADNDAAMAEAAARRSMDLKAQEDKVNTAMAEANRLGEINPRGRFAKTSTATDISLAVGGAIGGFLQGLRGGGQNDFMNTINQIIDRDIDAQKASAAAAQANVANQRGIYAMMRERFGDDAQAKTAQRAYLLDQAKMEAEKRAVSSQSVQVQEQARLAVSQLDKASALEKAKLVDMQEYRPAQVVGGAAPGMKKEDAGLLVRLPDGRTIQGRTEKEAQSLRAAIPAVAKMRRLAAEIDKRRTVGGLLSPENRAELETYGTEYVLAMKEASNAGALDKGLVEVAQNALGDPTGVFSFAGKKGLKYAELAEKGLGEVIRAQSGEQVTPGYGVDKSGNRVPTATYQGNQVRTQAMPTSFKPGAK